MHDGFHFIHILRAAFTRADPESAKKIDNLTVFFVLLESAYAKAAHRMLMKLTHGVNFNNILRDRGIVSAGLASARGWD